MTKTSSGNFFEDFRLGQTIRHATPRTVTHGDVALSSFLACLSLLVARGIVRERAPIA